MIRYFNHHHYQENEAAQKIKKERTGKKKQFERE